MRRVEESDRAWIHDLCLRRYPRYYDTSTGESWITNAVVRNPIQFYMTRSDGAFQITNLTAAPWTPTLFQADIVAVCAEEDCVWQVSELMRDSMKWAKSRNAWEWRFESNTDFDLGPIMRRLGAKTISPRYSMKFKEP